MKIPDKVYIPYEIGPDYISDNYYLGPTPKMENAEYISKDALLEWAKDMKAETEDVIKQHPEDESLLAEMHWWEVVITKINAV